MQHLLGVAEQVDRLRQRNPAQANALSVRMELQADCFAGLWARRADQARNILESGRHRGRPECRQRHRRRHPAKEEPGYVVPDAFTHGSSAQRVRWFKRGLESGDLRQCDTFGAAQL
ncbi:Predicted metalloprotease [Bordetella pertussis]|nr:Predicted metalloprotease [Bordetella pertussis]